MNKSFNSHFNMMAPDSQMGCEKTALELRQKPLSWRIRWALWGKVGLLAALSTGTMVVPASTWAATINVYRFIDTDGNNAYSGESLYTDPSTILLKKTTATKASYITLSGGKKEGYTVSPGEYKIWQFVNPASLAQFTNPPLTVPWSSEATALTLSVSPDNTSVAVYDPNGGSYSGQGGNIYFPFPNLREVEITSKKQELTGICDTPDVVLCGYNSDGSYPSECWQRGSNNVIQLQWTYPGNSYDNNTIKNYWNSSYYNPSTWNQVNLKDFIEGKVVATYGEVLVPYYGDTNPVSVLGICNYGTLKSPMGTPALMLEFADTTTDGANPDGKNFFANFGAVEGSVPPSNSWWTSLKGGNLVLQGVFPHSQELFGTEIYSGTFYNEGTIQGGDSVKFVDGNWGNYSDSPYSYFDQQTSTGGSVNLSFDQIYEKGAVRGGEGFSAHYADARNIQYSPVVDYTTWPYTSYGAGKGGNVTIDGTQLVASIGSFVKGGDGGDVTATDTTQGYSTNIEINGGMGGDVDILVNGSIGFSGFRGQGEFLRCDPDIMVSGKDTYLEAKKDVVIYGGDNWQLKLNNLSDNAITAGRNIILAVGQGGTIDLRGNSSKVFKAAGKVEIYADNVLLDPGVQLETLIEASEIVKGPNKILYHVVLTAQDVQGQPGETVSVVLKINNGSPKEDTYTLSADSEGGTPIAGLPDSITIPALKSKEVSLNITLPAKAGESDTITLKATSQADSTVIAATKIVATVPKPEVAEEKVSLQVTKQGEGTITAQGIDCGEDCEEEYVVNTEVKLTATPAEGYQFANWSGDCATDTVTMDAAKNCTATFAVQNSVPSITITKTGDGNGIVQSRPAGIRCGKTCQKDFPENSTVKLVAFANKGSIFTGWQGDCGGTAKKTTITVDKALNCDAQFEVSKPAPAGMYNLTVSVEGEGDGIVTANGINCAGDCQQNHKQGKNLVLKAIPDASSTFVGWSGDCEGTKSSLQVKLNQDLNCVATFQSK